MSSDDLTSFILYSLSVGSSGLSGLYTVVMKAAGVIRRVFQLLDRVSSMPKSGDKCPLGEQVGEVELNGAQVIAHRLSTVKTANIVAVVSDGQIVENGTRDELLDKNGLYTALVRRQQKPKSNLCLENYEPHYL
ncbi:hypothetical protein TSUD_208190 [Trifolium subterraneum]|uniref:ABC transmembrane type-1 domain-containing protein n=1 Tax=Trifolium subterraneum TaxID=3900 RepID=A0A2Z6NWY3_TRISU|nr:hypothetical protein TSUD_208190 [Trifolium subterraneum]